MSRVGRSKKQYIEALGIVLGARKDFKDLEYKKHPSNGEEYLILSAITGEVFMLDITGYSEENILHNIAELEVGGFKAVDNLITDFDKRLEIGRLFN